MTPVDQVGSGQDPDALRHLVEHSATAGTLDERYHGQLTSALELEALSRRGDGPPEPGTVQCSS